MLKSRQHLDLRKVIMNSKEFFCETKEFSIAIPALPRPTLKELKLGKNEFDGPYPIGAIKKDTSPEHPVILNLISLFEADRAETMDPNTWRRRLAPHIKVALGYQHAAWLIENRNKIPAFTSLRKKGNVYVIEFPALTTWTQWTKRGGSVKRRFRLERQYFICDTGESWELSSDFCEYDHFPNGRIAIAGKP